MLRNLQFHTIFTEYGILIQRESAFLGLQESFPLSSVGALPLFSQQYLTIHQRLLLQVSGSIKAELSGRLLSVCCVLYLGG